MLTKPPTYLISKSYVVSLRVLCGNDNVDVVHRRIDDGLGRDDTRPGNVGKYIYLVCDQYRVRIWSEVATNRFVGSPAFGRAELPTPLPTSPGEKASSDKSKGILRLPFKAGRALRRTMGRSGFEPLKAYSQQIYSLPRLAASVPTRIRCPSLAF
jgi:hypothetical protein